MQVQAVPLTSFVHDQINAHEGKAFLCESRLADELEREGLIRIRRVPVAQARAADAGKARDDGAGRPSSALPAAPVSPIATSQPSARGKSARRRKGA